jgi:hypothetical protein
VSAVHHLSFCKADPNSIDVIRTFPLNDHGMKLRLGGHIETRGEPAREYMTKEGLQRDAGEAAEVSIRKVWLVNADETIVHEIPIALIGDDISDYETDMADNLEEE